MISEKYLYFRKKRSLDPCTGSMYFGNIFRKMCFSKICTKTWKKWNNLGYIKVDNFRKSEFLSFTAVCIKKNCNLEYSVLYERCFLAQVFSCEFREISKNTLFTEQVWTTAFVNLDLSGHLKL